jgi:hypothetical protein
MIAVRYILLLRSWITVRPGVISKDYLLFLPSGKGVTQLGLLLAYFEGLTVALVLAGAAGIYLLWRREDRSLALLLVWLLAFPLVFILLLSFRTAVGTAYILPTAPILLDRLAATSLEVRPRWLPAATVAAIIAVAGGPTLISQYLDGRRYNFREAASWLGERLGPNDLVYSDQLPTMAHYLRGPKIQQLVANPDLLAESLRELRASGGRGTLWIVAPYAARGGHRTNPRLGSFKSWIYQNCRLRNAVGVARLDYRVNELQIFECTT